MNMVAESASVMDGNRVSGPATPPGDVAYRSGLGATVSHHLISFYRRHLTRYTPRCGRVGPSCSQIAAELGLIAGLVAFTHCEECRGRGA